METPEHEHRSLVARLIRFCLDNPLVVALVTVAVLGWGLMVAPFAWEVGDLPRDPVPVDAIPDIGENQQIVFTAWPGRSPQDIEDQITYPLTTALLGLPQVKSVRSFSMLGFSTIYVIFTEDAGFYWSRSRILEKLNSLPRETLPDGATPRLGPDATALGQVFWYTLEGRDRQGEPTGGWGPDELRSVQDWYVRYALQAVPGVAEVASIGGFVREYQIDVDPEAMRRYGVTLQEIYAAVRASNLDVGARTMEVNRVEYVIRGLGFLESLEDLRLTVVKQREHVPITLDQVATIQYGPAMRRGALDKAGAEAVGGVVVTRFGENPLAVIERVKAKIAEISPGLPRKELDDGTISQIEIVPFYDRTGLIHETLGTLEHAVTLEILITIVVVVLMVLHLRSALMLSGMLPLAVLMAFIGMKLFGVDANIVALSGIAIAIGTIVDVGIVITENILKHLARAGPDDNRREVIYRASVEVGGAVLTAVATTVISFLPVFTMEAAEGKLFRPLAYTKTFALIGAIIIALTILPPLAQALLSRRGLHRWPRLALWALVILAGLTLPLVVSGASLWVGFAVALFGVVQIVGILAPTNWQAPLRVTGSLLVALAVGIVLARAWAPLGITAPVQNVIFVVLLVAVVIGGMLLFIRLYPWLLDKALRFKTGVLAVSLVPVVLGFTAWLGFDRVFGWLPSFLEESAPAQSMAAAFPGLGEEFMPTLDEGSFLYMPTTMPHASIGEVMDVMRKQDMAINAIPEVESVVGKLGRAETALDPAPVSMIETIITYKPEYKQDANGRILRFRWDAEAAAFARDADGDLIPDADGRPYRQWRDEIQSPDDIWQAIVDAAQIPGTTSAPKLQPIAARLVMLQSGMRAPLGLKVFGPDLATIESTALAIEEALQNVAELRPETVVADRVVGKPYLEIAIDREAIARYGLPMQVVQQTIEVAIGGQPLTTTVEGRERYPVRVRYQRERRDSFEDLERTLVAAPDGVQVPLAEIAAIEYRRGPQVIKSEDTFLVGYVIFDKQPGVAEVEAVEAARARLDHLVAEGALELPAGVSYRFTGSYENQVRAEQRLRIVLPLALLVIVLILYLQFRRASLTLLVFSGIAYAWAGGFLLVWLYGQEWFLAVDVFGHDLRALFQIDTVNLSVAVWVGFLALFGIATDDGVLMTTYLEQRFREAPPDSINTLRQRVVEAASRRVRPAMMTTATTLLALLPVLTSTGRGAEVMVPMAIPTVGGMLLALLTVFVVPVLYAWVAESHWRLRARRA